MSEYFSADDPANLEFSATDMQAMSAVTLRHVLAHLAALPSQPSRGDFSNIEALCRSLREDAPLEACALEPLLDQLFDELIPRSFNTAAPGYLAYIPGGGVFPAALADLIANLTNQIGRAHV